MSMRFKYRVADLARNYPRDIVLEEVNRVLALIEDRGVGESMSLADVAWLLAASISEAAPRPRVHTVIADEALPMSDGAG